MSIKKLFSLDEFVSVLPGHFGKSQCGVGLSSVPLSTIGYEKRFNQSVDALLDQEKFVNYMKSQKTMEIHDYIKIKNINKGNN
jgi:hydroxyacylglutathione hydrolase